MSWQIPTQIEQDIIAGKATYRTFQTGVGGQSILPVPPNSYIVIFGYDFSPAGGGFKQLSNIQGTFSVGNTPIANNDNVRWFETQQISFYTGVDFYPFIHHCDVKTTMSPEVTNLANGIVTFHDVLEEIDNTPISRQVYITSPNDVTITHGLILLNPIASSNPIPITSRTPLGLTYGGSAQAVATQTDFGPVLTPQQFMQPSPKDYQDFAFGLLPANADGQAFATPDTTNGLLDATVFLTSLGITIQNTAASNYFLCLHYALYNKTIPEQRG